MAASHWGCEILWTDPSHFVAEVSVKDAMEAHEDKV